TDRSPGWPKHRSPICGPGQRSIDFERSIREGSNHMVTRVMDLTGSRPRTRTEVVPSICVELLMSVAKFGMEGSRETFEDGTTWFDEVRTKASPQLLADLEHVGAKEGSGWGNLAGVALGLSTDAPPFSSIPEFLAHLEPMSARDLWLI